MKTPREILNEFLIAHGAGVKDWGALVALGRGEGDIPMQWPGEIGGVKPNEISFFYRNYRGSVEERHVIPLDLRFDLIPHPEHHQQPGWALTAWDLERQVTRTFLLSNIMVPEALRGGGYVTMVLKLNTLTKEMQKP